MKSTVRYIDNNFQIIYNKPTVSQSPGKSAEYSKYMIRKNHPTNPSHFSLCLLSSGKKRLFPKIDEIATNSLSENNIRHYLLTECERNPEINVVMIDGNRDHADLFNFSDSHDIFYYDSDLRIFSGFMERGKTVTYSANFLGIFNKKMSEKCNMNLLRWTFINRRMNKNFNIAEHLYSSANSAESSNYYSVGLYVDDDYTAKKIELK